MQRFASTFSLLMKRSLNRPQVIYRPTIFSRFFASSTTTPNHTISTTKSPQHLCSSFNIRQQPIPVESHQVSDEILQLISNLNFKNAKILERGKRSTIYYFQDKSLELQQDQIKTEINSDEKVTTTASNEMLEDQIEKPITMKRHTNPLKNVEKNPSIESNQEMFMILYSFGAVAFVNVSETDQQIILQNLKQKFPVLHSSSSPATIPPHQETHQENLVVVVNENLKDWCRLGFNQLLLKKLNLYNINVICALLARSASLKSYEVQVQWILENFKELNSRFERKEEGNAFFQKELVPSISELNGLKCDLLANVRLFDRLSISWDFDEYDELYDSVFEEFEIEDRYKILEKKIEFIQQNTQFYLELNHSRKIEKLEWLIIILIALEGVLAILQHNQLMEMEEKKKKKQKSL